MIYYYIY